ncbi:MAG: anti-sigma factor family protein, partial [Prosthecobacter sp.]
MNDERFDHLISAHLHGLLTSEERTELEQRLLHSAADREHFWQEAEMHSMMHASQQTNIVLPELPRAAATPWFVWRPLTAAAAGIMLGMFCTSVVFGYVMPRAVATASRLFALVDGSFEKTTGRVGSGFPAEFGVWSGDEAEAADTVAVDGRRALRFVRAEREVALPNYGAASCDVYQ